MAGRSLEELRDELHRLMMEQIESLKEQTFEGKKESVRRHEERLRRIREVSANYLLALKKKEAGEERGVAMKEKPKVTLPARVEKVIEPKAPHETEKAQISVEQADPLYQEVRIENKLKDENGNEVRLKEGAEVEVTVEAHRHATTPKDGAH